MGICGSKDSPAHAGGGGGGGGGGRAAGGGGGGGGGTRAAGGGAAAPAAGPAPAPKPAPSPKPSPSPKPKPKPHPQSAPSPAAATAATAAAGAFQALDRFYSAVDTMAVHTKKAYGEIFHGGAETARLMDETFRRRVEDARGGAERLRVVFAAPLSLDGGGLSSYEAPVRPKTDGEASFLRGALGGSFLFESLGDREMGRVVDAFERRAERGGTEIIREGDAGDYMYVIQDGTVRYVVGGSDVGTGSRGDVFGMLALLYNSPRAATCIAEGECTLWRLDQTTFRKIMATAKMRHNESTKQLLRKVDFLKDLDDESLTKIAYVTYTKTYQAGEHVMKKGESAAQFTIVKEGRLEAKNIEVGGQNLTDMEFGPGEHFGANTIMKNVSASGDVVATERTTVVCIAKERFAKVFGEYEDLIRKDMDKKLLTAAPIRNKPEAFQSALNSMVNLVTDTEYSKGHVFYWEGTPVHPTLYLVRSGKISLCSARGTEKVISGGGLFGEGTVDCANLEDEVIAPHTAAVLEDCVVGILSGRNAATVLGGHRREGEGKVKMEDLKRHRILGAGTFGQVWLVNRKGTKEAYALKIQFKRQLIDSNQAEGVIREKEIMSQLDSDFIIKLFGSYQDDKNVYMLMKLYQGGELWSVMHDEALQESSAKFYAASVLEGLNYMHRRHILYRDLKPENVLLDSDGYTVIVDLGFAKFVPDMTYTFCGTPLYIAPEVVLQRGHDKGADHWSWGVMVYEMICGITPFYEKNIDQMTLFKRIINSTYNFPAGEFVSKNAKDLIAHVLVPNPVDRLGSFAGGGKDIQDHRWFNEVDCEKLAKKELTPPWRPKITDPLDVSNFDNWDHLADKEQKGAPLTAMEQKLFKDF